MILWGGVGANVVINLSVNKPLEDKLTLVRNNENSNFFFVAGQVKI